MERAHNSLQRELESKVTGAASLDWYANFDRYCERAKRDIQIYDDDSMRVICSGIVAALSLSKNHSSRTAKLNYAKYYDFFHSLLMSKKKNSGGIKFNPRELDKIMSSMPSSPPNTSSSYASKVMGAKVVKSEVKFYESLSLEKIKSMSSASRTKIISSTREYIMDVTDSDIQLAARDFIKRASGVNFNGVLNVPLPNFLDKYGRVTGRAPEVSEEPKRSSSPQKVENRPSSPQKQKKVEKRPSSPQKRPSSPQKRPSSPQKQKNVEKRPSSPGRTVTLKNVPNDAKVTISFF